MRKILLPFYEIPTMAKIIKQLTIAQVNNAKAAEKIYYLFDGEGLKLVVKPNGVKTWVFNYKRPYTLKRTEKTIGTYPTVSLKDARQKAQEFRQLLANKIDPHEFEQKQAAEALKEQCSTFSHVANEWLLYRAKIGKEQGNYTERTKIDTERRVNAAIDLIGDVSFKELTLKHGLSVLEPHRQSGATAELKKRYLVLKSIAEYAERFEYWENNKWKYLGDDLPAVNKNKHHPSIHYKALPEFMISLARANISQTVRRAILWGLLNATRASETVSAKYSDIREHENLPNGKVWQVVISKGGKGERLHLVPLSKQAETLLSYIKQHTNKEYLFPSTLSKARNEKHINSQTPNEVIKTMDGGKYKGTMTNHGIRSIFSSYCNDNRLELGLDKEVIEICLSHLNSDEIRNAYNRAEYLPYRLKTFQEWANYVEKCANGLFKEIIADKS